MKRMNSKTMRKMTVAGVLALSLAVAGLALAQGPGAGKGMRGQRGAGLGDGPGSRIEMLAQRLDLSEEQVAAIEAIHEKARQDGVELRKDLMRLRNELKGEMLQDNPAEKTVLDLNKKMGAVRTELKAIRLKTRLAVRNELTPEQRDKMLMMGDGWKNGRKGRGPGRAGGPGCVDGRGPGSGFGSRYGRFGGPDGLAN